jgi:2-octaprenyl-6-methoxyphenol hydroxylase
MTAAVDIAIVGGGLVGASLALGLADSGHTLALVEAAPPPAGEPRWDERCIALNHASRRIFESLGAWDELSPAATPITSTHISERGRFGVARFTAVEAGLDALGHNIPVRHLGETLWRRAGALPGLTTLCPARVEGLQAIDGGLRLLLDGERRIDARLVVAADGAGSAIRGLLGIDAERRDYAQSAIVTAVRVARPVAGCAYERFTPEGPIALLPKPGDACSLVWTTPAERVDERLQLDDAAFLAIAQDAFGERLGRFSALGKRQAWPLTRVMSERLTAPRAVFVGNAAQSLHPVAAQGFNLGLRDVATLAELLRADASRDPGAPDLLAEYANLRTRDRARVSDFTDQLVRVFSNRVPGLRGLRHLGLLALDLAPPLKDAVMWQNLGFGAQTPQMARRGA